MRSVVGIRERACAWAKKGNGKMLLRYVCFYVCVAADLATVNRENSKRQQGLSLDSFRKQLPVGVRIGMCHEDICSQNRSLEKYSALCNFPAREHWEVSGLRDLE